MRGTVFFVLLFVLALICRVIWIDLRPFHNDEGVNYHFIQEMRQKGYYPYSHENYHGPSYFYMTMGMVSVLGDGELGMRASAIVSGLLLLLLILQVARYFGREGTSALLAFLALSPSLVFFSRYAIHESLFLLATTWCGLSLFLWIQGAGRWTIYSGYIGLALLVATKETFIISLASLGLATIAVAGPKQLWQRITQDLAPLSWGFCLFAFIVAAFFTGGFQWGSGLTEMALAVPQWFGRGHGDVGHFKPFWYYASVMLRTEPVTILAGLIPLLGVVLYGSRFLGYLTSSEGKWGLFLTIWTLSSFLVYSYVPYKTVWLIINITGPALLAVVWWWAELYRRESLRYFATVLLGVSLVGQGALSWYWNIKVPYGPANPFSYTHTSAGMMQLVREIEKYRANYPAARVLVGVGAYWPLPYYLRKESDKTGYLKTNDLYRYGNEYDIVILDKDDIFEDPGWRRIYLRLSDVQESQTYFRIKPQGERDR